MPNGQKYEDWLKTPEGQDWLKKHQKAHGEDGKNSGLRNRSEPTSEKPD